MKKGTVAGRETILNLLIKNKAHNSQDQKMKKFSLFALVGNPAG